MRITGIETTLFSGVAGAPGAGCIVELLTDTNLRGVAIGAIDLRTALATLTRKFLAGEDPRAAPALWQRMQVGRNQSPGSAAARAAMALLDVALWDLKAKANHEPLWKTLGGARPAVNAVAVYGDAVRDDTGLDQWFEHHARGSGIKSGMLRPGRDAGADRRRLGKVGGLLAGDASERELGLDAGTWAPARVIRRLRELERRFDLAWVAVSASRADPAGLGKISGSVRAAVCAGRGLRFPADFRAHFSRRSIDLVQVDLGVNGITGAMQLADAAFGLELPVMLCAAPGNIQAQVGGAMPYVKNAEVTAPECVEAPFTSDIRVMNGRVIAGDAPGNGLAIDRAALTRCRVERLPARRGGR